jgi:acyl-homoserine lactone synthase
MRRVRATLGAINRTQSAATGVRRVLIAKRYATAYYLHPHTSGILHSLNWTTLGPIGPDIDHTMNWRMSVIQIVTPENDYHYRAEMEQAYRLRHQVFVEEMGWDDLAKPNGREIDQFDNKHAVHMLYIEEGQVLGYQRLLPSTRPHLLSEIMPELCEVERPVGAHIWEISRHCVAPGHREKGRFASPIANVLGSGLLEWAFECGVSKFIIETEPMGLLPLVQLLFHPMPLGFPRKIAGRDVIATLTFDRRTLNRLRKLRGTRRRVFAEPVERPVLLHA